MATLAKLIVKLVGDVSDYEKAMEQAEKKFKNVGASLTSAGTKMTAGVTLPIVGMGLLTVNAASDMEESLSKVNVVFGENADEIIAWSETAATSMGQSQQEALEAVGTYGNLLTAIGVMPDQATEMSKSFVELAGDLASFNNASPEETLLALRSALSGEMEPMKRFGVAINQAAIDQKALQMGLIKTKDEMTPAIKTQAVYALVLEQTTTAQGDFERTSEGLANSQRILGAQFKDVAASIGEQLLPIAMDLINVVRGWLERFQAISPEMQRVILIVLGVAAAIGPLLIIVGTLASAIGSVIPIVTAVVGVLSGPLLLIIGAVIAVIALLTMAWKNNWGDIQGKTKAAIDWIRNKIQVVLDWIKAFWDQHGQRIMGIVQSIWDTVVGIFQWFVDYVSTIFEAFRLAFSGDWEGFGQKLREAWDMVWEAVKDILGKAWDWIKNAVSEGVEAIIKWFTETDWAEVGTNILKGIAGGITAATQWVIDAVTKVAGAIWDALKGFFGFGSPAKLMIDMGKKLMGDWAMGMESMGKMPAMAMIGAANRITNAGAVGAVATGRQPASQEINHAGSSVIVYGGLHLHDVQDKDSLIEQLRDLST
jgi:phage-related protein